MDPAGPGSSASGNQDDIEPTKKWIYSEAFHKSRTSQPLCLFEASVSSEKID
jgi:hypothetical protein